MKNRKSGSLGMLAFVTTGIVSYGALAFLVGCNNKNSQPEQPKASVEASRVDGKKPSADAEEKVRTFEAKRAQAKALLIKTLTEQDRLVVELQEAGVNKIADLKGNLRGQELAKAVGEITVEIKSLELHIKRIDNAILQAKALVRRSEREQIGISEVELGKLAEQMKEAEEGTEGVANLVTPFDVESALEKLLSSPTKPQTASKSVAQKDEAKSGTSKDAQTKSAIPPAIVQTSENGSKAPPSMNLSGVWIDEGEGIFDVKHEGEKVTWRGRSPDGGKTWSNAFDGRLVKNGNCYLIVGAWRDVPPGSYTGNGTLTLLVDGSNCLRAIEETGGYGGAVWKRKVKYVTVEDLDRNPAKYKGQTVRVVCQLSGTTFPSDMQRLRLNVKGEKKLVTASSVHPDGINFMLPKSKQSLLDGFTEFFSPATLTVAVNQGIRGNWLATVSGIERTAP